MSGHGTTPGSSLFRDARKALGDAAEGIKAFEADPDSYCACDPGKPCYLHGVAIPKAVTALERAMQELRRKAFPPKRDQ